MMNRYSNEALLNICLASCVLWYSSCTSTWEDVEETKIDQKCVDMSEIHGIRWSWGFFFFFKLMNLFVEPLISNSSTYIEKNLYNVVKKVFLTFLQKCKKQETP